MATYHSWFTDQELPGIPFEHRNNDGTVIDFSSGWTFTAKIVRDTTIVMSQTTNIVGAATSPNITLTAWTTAVLTAVAADLTTLGATSHNYELQVYMRRTADSADEVPTSTQPLTVQFKRAAV